MQLSGPLNQMVLSSDFVLPATDGYPLAARLWLGENEQITSRTAIINAGAGIGMRYYDAFARYLATYGIPTLLYDYRGIANSRPVKLRGFSASVEDWGSKDCAAALEWSVQRFPKARRIVIGHSVGGFVTGFVTNGHRIDRIVLIGAHTGYWRDYAARSRPAMYLLWHAAMPAVTRVVGFFPGRKLRLLDDLPAGIANEWANRRRAEFWWNRVTPDGEPDVTWRDSALNRFRAIRASILAVRFADDAFATESATTRLLELYENCIVTQLTRGSIDADGKKIGHFGFFRTRFSETLWPPVLHWMLDRQ